MLLALALALFAPASCFAHEYSYDNLLLAWMKLKGEDYDYKANAESYLRLYRPDTWEAVKNNEFELDDETKKTITIMQRKVKDFDLTEEFTLTMRMHVGKYDFEDNLFPLSTEWGGAVDKSTYWYPRSRYPSGTLPRNVRVYFSNPDLLASLPMSKEDAKQLIQGRKQKDRVVNVRVQFRLVKAREGAGEILAEVQSVTICDTLGKKRLLYKATKSRKEK
jgi:hypothetical protein